MTATEQQKTGGSLARRIARNMISRSATSSAPLSASYLSRCSPSIWALLSMAFGCWRKVS